MDHSRYHLALLVVVASDLCRVVSCSWESWHPHRVERQPEIQHTQENLNGTYSSNDPFKFKLLLVDEPHIIIGGKDSIYHINTNNIRQYQRINWIDWTNHMDRCRARGHTDCSNYVRVGVKKDDGSYLICGTNGYNPVCRHYRINSQRSNLERFGAEENLMGVCPLDGASNSTALFADGKLYSATQLSPDGGSPFIAMRHGNTTLTSRDRDNSVLNDPQFVSSFEKDDMVYFFFRETAEEHENCGKATFSRVARVCKNDAGGNHGLRSKFTSLFKARLSCSLPGDLPFYFNEIQSTSEFGQGYLFPTPDRRDRETMIYGVFNTPDNSIHASAVCAFSYADIASAFQGAFKNQESPQHQWLPVSWTGTPETHPGKCVNNSQELPMENQEFIVRHTLMDRAVTPNGGRPLLVLTGFRARFTQIAIDWKRRAADDNYYDVMFVGTDDGRIIKAISKVPGEENLEAFVIEDRQVLYPRQPVVGLRLIQDRGTPGVKLLVMSSQDVVIVPVHRCDSVFTCRECVALRDPYCAWNTRSRRCAHNARNGVINIATGEHSRCRRRTG